MSGLPVFPRGNLVRPGRCPGNRWISDDAGRQPSVPLAIAAAMSIKATIMDAATGKPIQTFLFGRRPYAGTGFTLASGEKVTAQRVDIGKPGPGSFATPVDVWVTIRT
jgi:hypothetical protein